MKTKELPIYTNVIDKGNALKIKACRLYSFSEKEKQQMKYFCECLDLSEEIYKVAKEIYMSFLKVNLDKGVFTPTRYIAASIYLAAILELDSRTQKNIETVSGTTSSTIGKCKNRIIENIDMDKYL